MGFLSSQCPADSDLASPFRHGREHDIHDADPSNQQRNTCDDDEQHIEHGSGSLGLPQQLFRDDNSVVFFFVILAKEKLDDPGGDIDILDVLNGHGDLAQLDVLTLKLSAHAPHYKIADSLPHGLQRNVRVEIVIPRIKTSTDRSGCRTALCLANHNIKFAAHPDRFTNRILIREQFLCRHVREDDHFFTMISRG